MRLVIDLQACQSAGSRFRGIGRYSRSLAEAMLRAGRGHEVWIALNGGLPDTIEPFEVDAERKEMDAGTDASRALAQFLGRDEDQIRAFEQPLFAGGDLLGSG